MPDIADNWDDEVRAYADAIKKAVRADQAEPRNIQAVSAALAMTLGQLIAIDPTNKGDPFLIRRNEYRLLEGVRRAMRLGQETTQSFKRRFTT